MGLPQVFRNSPEDVWYVSVYAYAIVTNGCCSRPHPSALEQTLHFPTNRKNLLVIPEEDVSHHQQTSGEHLVSPSLGQGDAFLEKTHHLFDSFYSPIFLIFFFLLFLPPKSYQPLGSPALSPDSSPCQLPAPGLCSVWFPSWPQPSRCKLETARRPSLTLGPNLAQFPDQQAASSRN